VSRLDGVLAGVLVVFFLVGGAGHLVPATRPLFVGLAPAALLLTAAVVAAVLVGERNLTVGLWAACSAAAAFGVEVAGVATGVIFGSYSYGRILGTPVLGVPPIIGVNWAVVVLGSVSFTTRFLRSPILAASLAGALSAGFDALLEPFAISAGYWRWAAGTVPLRNYAAWFLVAAVLAYAYARLPRRMDSPLASVAVGIEVVFFAVLRAVGA